MGVEPDHRNQDQAAVANGLDLLRNLVASDLSKVNAIILARMDSPIGLIPQLAGHIVAAGGKRIRPLLTLACARLCDAEGDRQMGLAAAVEFIHTATLLHDDVVDESDQRRGQATAKAIWGNKASVLVGDFLFSRAFQLMVDDGAVPVLRLLSDTAATIAQGEVHQLMTTGDTATDETAYLQVVEGKTAALFAAACQVAALIAERSRAEEKALRDYGMSLGIAFQLVDDILDYTAEQPRLGKNVGDDFREGKITLPIVYAFARGNEDEKRFWRRCLEEVDQRDGDLEHAVQLLHRHGALADARQRAVDYGARARSALDIFPDRPERRALIGAIDFCIDRLY